MSSLTFLGSVVLESERMKNMFWREMSSRAGVFPKSKVPFFN